MTGTEKRQKTQGGTYAASKVIAQDREVENSHAQRMEAVGRLAGGIAHDFNNLLTVILGYSELLLSDLTPQHPMRENLEEIHRAADRAAVLTRQLLAFSRKQVVDPRVLDLNTIVSNIDRLLRRVIGEEIDLWTLLGSDLGKVRIDSGQIEQVILNLALNARDAMPEGGKLTIETLNADLDQAYVAQHPMVRAGRYILLAVSDTGCGMDGEVQAHLFEPFFTTKAEGKGTGLGLATVYAIIKQNSGYIWVYSEPGRGTTFKIYLPRVEEGVPDIKPAATLLGPAHGSEVVLLVEDDDKVRTITREILTRNGYQVLEASHGEHALSICEQHKGPIHLLLTDMIMPQLSGPALAHHVQSVRPGLRVLYMSGYTDSMIVRHGMLAANAPHLPKPFTGDALVCKVREVLDESRPG